MRKIVTMTESKQMDQNMFGSYRIQQNPRISVTFERSLEKKYAPRQSLGHSEKKYECEHTIEF